MKFIWLYIFYRFNQFFILFDFLRNENCIYFFGWKEYIEFAADIRIDVTRKARN
jgi:hypothetical protein